MRDDEMCGVSRVAFHATIALMMSGLVTPPVRAESGSLRSPGPDQVAALQSDSRDIRISDEFAVNLDNSYRIVIPDKCGEAGETELIRLAEMAKFEESYVFIPSLCLWIEVGYNETAMNVRLDTQFVVGLLSDYPSLMIYHIHTGVPAEITDYLPAYSDLVGLVVLNGDYLNRPDTSISHRVMTSRGMIEYALVISEGTELLLKKFARFGLSDFVGQNLAYEFSRDVHKQDYYAAVQDCDRMSSGDPERLADCFPMIAGDFILQHKAVASYLMSGATE